MKKRFIIAGLIISIILGISLAVISIELQAAEVKGHRLYDPISGEMNGCQSPGSDCTYKK
jgi:hypothetical protein